MKTMTTYYRSKQCPQMAFACQSDADNFDNALLIAAEGGKAEFDEACYEYPSFAAVVYAIHQQQFHFNMRGQFLDEVITQAENMIAGFDGLDDDDCYTCPTNYLLYHFYPELQGKL